MAIPVSSQSSEAATRVWLVLWKAAHAIERITDRLAQELKMDPAALRIRQGEKDRVQLVFSRHGAGQRVADYMQLRPDIHHAY